jgi:copper chaperone CopZ
LGIGRPALAPSQEISMKDMDVEIGGMSCGSCVRRVANAFKKVEGVLKCDVEVGKAKLTYDETKIDLERILDVVRQSGYTVKGELG